MMCFSQDNYYRQPKDTARTLMKLGKEVSVALNASVTYSPTWGDIITQKIKELAREIWAPHSRITSHNIAQWEVQKDEISCAIIAHFKEMRNYNNFQADNNAILRAITGWIYPFVPQTMHTNMWITTQIDHVLSIRCFKTMHSAELFTDCLVFLDSTVMETGLNTTATAGEVGTIINMAQSKKHGSSTSAAQ